MDLAKALAQFNPHTATPDALVAQIAAWAEEAQRLQEQADLVARQHREIHLKDTKIKALTLELAYHKRIKFCSTSEAFTAQQCDLFNETQETDLNAMQAELEQLSSTPRVKAKPTGRKPLPAELPRVEQRHEPDSCACGACGQTLVKIGEDITEQLDVEPARFFVQRLWPYRAGTHSCKSVSLRRRRAMLCKFPTSPYPATICLPSLRNHHCCSDTGDDH